ncbi:hypothetical protein AYO39_02810 [Actinobacteria bacterium SCGC AG-212-D09]|nr:hypothetical protein AYO39_02810 [Actinobacteria bacterium SCGC AG-212-D09]
MRSEDRDIIAVSPARARLVIEDRKDLRKSSGPTYLGGGVGLTAAAEGILMASALQGMTGAFTRRGTIIGVETEDGYFVVENVGSEAYRLRKTVKAILGSRDEDKDPERAVRASSPDGLLDGLERLVVLKQQGLLTDAEFERAKSKLLD